MAAVRRAARAAAIALAICLAAPEADAQSDSAPPPIAADPATARADLDRLADESRRDPANLDKLYRLATTAVTAEDYETAISALERMLIFNPKLPRVRLELGVLYYRLGSFEIARLQLQRAVEGPDVPDEVRERVAEYLTAIADRTARNLFDVEVTTGLRWQTNPAATSDPTDVRIGDLLFETGDGNGADWSAFLVGRLTHAYRFDTQWDDELVTRLQTFGELYRQQSELDVTVNELESGPSFGLGRAGLQGSALRPFVTLGYTMLDRDYYYSWAGYGLELRTVIAQRVQTRLRGRVRRQVYTDRDATPYGDRTGWRQDVSLGASVPFSTGTFLDGFAYLEHAGANQAYRAYYETGASLLVGQLVELPEPAAVGPLTLYAGGNLANARYQAADPVIEPGTQRHDWSYAVRGGFSLDLTEQAALIGEIEYRFINSNISLYEYDNTSYTLGVRLRF